MSVDITTCTLEGKIATTETTDRVQKVLEIWKKEF